MAIQSDGRILVAGCAFTGLFEDFALARYNPDGSLDATFDIDGKVLTPVGSSSDRATGVLIQTDSRIVVTGTVSNGFNDDFAAVRYNSDGSLDNSLYGTRGKTVVDLSGENDVAVASLLDNFGRAVIVGTSGGKYGVLRLLGDLAPTASNVAVSGRILTAVGIGLQNAVVTLTDASGASRRARSSTFGYYRFDGVRAGETYLVTVASKRYLYAPRVLSVEDDLTNVDFIPVSGDEAQFRGFFDPSRFARDFDRIMQ